MVAKVKARVTGGMDWMSWMGEDRTAIAPGLGSWPGEGTSSTGNSGYPGTCRLFWSSLHVRLRPPPRRLPQAQGVRHRGWHCQKVCLPAPCAAGAHLGVFRKKKKSKRKQEQDEPVIVQQVPQDDKPGSASGSGRSTPAIASSSEGGPRKTDAERRFEEVQKKRVGSFSFMTSLFDRPMQLAERVAKLAGKTHKDRVNDFNAKLEALSEHHDIPKASARWFTSDRGPLRFLSGWARLTNRRIAVPCFASTSLPLLYLVQYLQSV